MKGETFKGKTPQEGKMDVSSEKVLMQKMLKCMEAQVEVLKKIISYLSEIEEEEAEENKANHGQSESTYEDINRIMTKGKELLKGEDWSTKLKKGEEKSDKS
nr:hypothetical protein CFP56_21378 [Quercus suber]